MNKEELDFILQEGDQLMKERGLEKPKFDISENFFEIDFYGPGEAVLGEKATTKKTSEKTSEKIIALIKSKPDISAKKLSQEIGISSRAIEMHLYNLKKLGKIKRVGADKGGHWEVLK